MEISRPTTKEEFSEMQAIYEDSFPECEKKPFSLIIQKMNGNLVDMWSIKESGEIYGIAITMKYKDIVLLDYFAMETQARGRGFGTRALEQLKRIYDGKRFFLEVESTLEEGASNQRQRIRRKEFYLRNGLHEIGMVVEIYQTQMEVLTFGGEITYEEYRNLYRQVYGNERADSIRLI